jgi:hypothetical protein
LTVGFSAIEMVETLDAGLPGGSIVRAAASASA